MGDRQIDTEHFLLALLRQGEGIVAEVFAANGITLDQARDAVRSLVITRANGEADGITFTLRARRMLTQALREALSTEQVEIDPRHILLALLDPRAGVASQVVRDLDLDAATISSALDIAGDRPDAWVSIKLQLIDWRIERLDAFILAAKSPPELLDTLSASSDDADTAAAIATLLDISEHAARYVIRQPIVRFTPAGIAAAERTRDNLARRRKKQVSQD
jgi:ATP-dependent Clp protease ATP-binding subunit ClpA